MNKICRLCLSDKINLFNLFELIDFRGETSFYLPEIISICVGIEVSTNDIFPTKVCSECVQSLKNAIEFREKCLKSHTELLRMQNILLQEQKPPDIDTYLPKLENVDVVSHTPKKTDLKPENAIKPNKRPAEKTKMTQKLINLFNKKPEISEKIEPEVDRSVECNICGRIIKKKCHLKTHIKAHHPDGLPRNKRPFQCEICGKRLRKRSNLEHHYRTHDGKKDFPCQMCEKSFGHKSTLTVHMKRHLDDRKHTCDICGRGFITLVSLTEHKNTRHNTVKSFQCPQCEKAFKTMKCRREHELIHDKSQSFPCPSCDRIFFHKTNLNVHFKKRHKDENKLMVLGK